MNGEWRKRWKRFQTRKLILKSGGTEIEVYPTMADLEQDLPNLNEGDIVATEDYKPFDIVDEVAPGVMSAVTSNAVANRQTNILSYNDETPMTSKGVYDALYSKTIKLGTWGVLGGATGGEETSLQELWNHLCGQQPDGRYGVGGICGGSFQDSDGWRTYLYTPHRTGINGDNYMYGNLITFPMVGQNATINIYRTTPSGFSLIKSL